MPTQRVILGAGLAILLLIGAASIGLDVKSRSDAAWVDHTVEVLKKISDVRLLIRRAESAARGYEIYRGPSFMDEFRRYQRPDRAGLRRPDRSVRDNPDQVALLESTEPLTLRRIEIVGDMIRLRAGNDSARHRRAERQGPKAAA